MKILNGIDEDIRGLKDKLSESVEDVSLWKRESGYKDEFSTSETWKLIRERKSKCSWARGVWFSQATPKCAFIVWLASLNRLSTMDRIAQWNIGVDEVCVLCRNAYESRNHLFFDCFYSGQVWENLVRGIMGNSFAYSWLVIMNLISGDGGGMGRKKLLCLRYSFQLALYAVWLERNRVKHGEKLFSVNVLKKLLDKGVRNKLWLLRARGVKGMEDTLQLWFATRV